MKSLLQFLVAKIILMALASTFVSCYDPSPLQDYCVAVENIDGVYTNGAFCKDPTLVTADDFYTSGLSIPGNTSNRDGSFATGTSTRIPGANTLGVNIARIDIAPGGQIPPHTHPRTSEMILVLKGKLLTGFVTSDNYNNTLFSKVLYPGDVFIHPIGLPQFHANIGKTNVVAIGAVGSQNPGRVTLGDAVFGSKPLIEPKILARAFATDVDEIRRLQDVFSS